MRNTLEKGHFIADVHYFLVAGWDGMGGLSQFFYVRSVHFALPLLSPPPPQQVFNYERTESGHGSWKCVSVNVLVRQLLAQMPQDWNGIYISVIVQLMESVLNYLRTTILNMIPGGVVLGCFRNYYRNRTQKSSCLSRYRSAV